MKTLLLFLTIPALLLFAACGNDNDHSSEGTPTSTDRTRTPVPTGAGGSSTGDGGFGGTCAENPDPATDEVVQVDTPAHGDSVTSPLAVRGRIAAFEATFQITLFDIDGNILTEVVGMSSEGQTLAPFEEEVSFSVADETLACLWVYELSARDGSPINVRHVGLLLLP